MKRFVFLIFIAGMTLGWATDYLLAGRWAEGMFFCVSAAVQFAITYRTRQQAIRYVVREEIDELNRRRTPPVLSLRWAERLILQLPEHHDGRNMWLQEYGSDSVAAACVARVSEGT